MRIMSEFGEIVNRYDQRRQVAQATEDVAKEEAKKPLEEQLPDAKLFKPRKKGRRSLTEEELQALQRREDAVANKERRARQAAFGKARGGRYVDTQCIAHSRVCCRRSFGGRCGA